MIIIEENTKNIPNVGVVMKRVEFGDVIGVYPGSRFSGPCFENLHTRVLKWWWGDCEFTLPSLAFAFFVLNDYRKV